MKNIAAAFAVVLAASFAAAETPTDKPKGSIAQDGAVNQDQSTVTPQRESSSDAQPTDKQRTSGASTASPKVSAIIVSADSSAKTITVRNPAQGSDVTATDTLTLPVEGQAGSSLAGYKAGERVSLTCRASASPSGLGSGASAGSGTVSGSAGQSTAANQAGGGADLTKRPGSAPADTGWASVHAAQCVAVTDIAKANAGAFDESPASSKSRSKIEDKAKDKKKE